MLVRGLTGADCVDARSTCTGSALPGELGAGIADGGSASNAAACAAVSAVVGICVPTSSDDGPIGGKAGVMAIVSPPAEETGADMRGGGSYGAAAAAVVVDTAGKAACAVARAGDEA